MKKSLIALAMLACCMSAAGENGSDTGGTGAGATPPAPPAPAPKLTKVRLLMDCEHGKANDVVHLPVDVAKAAVDAGHGDDSRAAVKYAESLPQNQPKPA